MQSSSQFRSRPLRPDERRLRGGRQRGQGARRRRRGDALDPKGNPDATSPSGGRARRSRAGTASPASSIARDHLDSADRARLLAMKNLAARTQRSTTGTTSTTSTSGGRSRRSAGRRTDGNPATSPDPTWTPLISAPYPDHVSGHIGLDGSHTPALQMFFGNAPEGLRDHEQLRVPVARYTFFNRFSQPLERSSTPASGRASTSAPRTCRAVTRNQRREFRGRNYFQPVGNH